jgi:HEAT repeat protein
VLGNVGTAEEADVLRGALEDPDPLVRGHAAWALGRVGPIEPLPERVTAKTEVETG